MSRYFFDSSALVKRYCPEVGTAQVNRLFADYASLQKTPLLGTLDALHLASALDLHRDNALDVFVSADKDLCEAAEAEGLGVSNLTL